MNEPTEGRTAMTQLRRTARAERTTSPTGYGLK
jgi:hypothetical protein